MNKPNQFPDPNQTTITLAAQLFLTHFIVAGLSFLIWAMLGMMASPAKTAIVLTSAGLIGLLLTLNLQRTLRWLDWTLVYLIGQVPLSSLGQRRDAVLKGIVGKMAILAEQQRPLTDLRERQLQQATTTAAQEERHRLARDLHDSIKQQLFSIQISAAAVQARWENDETAAKTALIDVRQSAKAALVEMNALLNQLSPTPLENVGLVQALQEQAEALAYRTGANVQVDIADLPANDHFLSGTQEAIFRIVQEAFSNIARHARAQQVNLRLEIPTPTTLSLEIEDDGVGFETTAVAANKSGMGTHGMGLQNIHQRVTKLDGQLDIQSHPQQGTTIRIVLPLADYHEAQEQIMYQPDHALNKLSLTGLFGGLAIAAFLFYPLYTLNDWLSGAGGNAVIGVICALLAGATAVGTGYLGAKQLRQTTYRGNIIGGGLVGLIASTIFFAIVGGATASLIGAQTLLQYGYQSALSDNHMLYLIADAVNGIMWWVFGSFWVVIVVGTLLGMIGGALAPHQPDNPADNEHLRGLGNVALVALLLSSTLMLVIASYVFALLGERIWETAVDIAVDGYLLTLPVWGSAFWPIFTSLLIYLLSLGGAILLFAQSSLTSSHVDRWERLVSAYVESFAAAFVPVLFFAAGAQFRGGWPLVGMIVNLIATLLLYQQADRVKGSFPLKTTAHPTWELINRLSFPVGAVLVFLSAWSGQYVGALGILFLMMIVLFVTDQHEWQKMKRPYPIALARAIESFATSILVLILPGVVIVSAALGIMTLVIPSIPILNSTPSPFVLTEQVKSLYKLQAMSFGTFTLFGFVGVGIVLLIFKIMKNVTAQKAESTV